MPVPVSATVTRTCDSSGDETVNVTLPALRLYLIAFEPKFIKICAKRVRSTETIGTWHLGADEATSWKHVDVALPSLGTIGDLEFAVTRSTKGARVLIGDARMTRETAIDPPLGCHDEMPAIDKSSKH